jgi:Etoposide-induced protein 2.4 (EI24)
MTISTTTSTATTSAASPASATLPATAASADTASLGKQPAASNKRLASTDPLDLKEIDLHAAAAQSPSHLWLATKAFAKSSLGLLNPKVWLLSLLPLVLAGLIWAAIGYVAWEPANNLLRGFISGFDAPLWFPDWIPPRSTWIPLTVLLITVPLVLITAMILVGVFGTGITARRVGGNYGLTPLPVTGLSRGVTVLGSVWHSAWVLVVLAVLWLLALPMYALLGVGALLQLMVLAWANARLFSRDVLVEFATKPEREALFRQHRGTLWGLGILASIPAVIPSAMWMGGAVATIALPVMALISVWLYVMIFLATSLLYSHYLLPALKTMREVIATEQAAAKTKADKAAAAEADRLRLAVQSHLQSAVSTTGAVVSSAATANDDVLSPHHKLQYQ